MSKRVKIVLLLLSVALTVYLSFSVGCVLGSTATPSEASGLDVVQQAWGIIFKDYVDNKKLDSRALSEAAIKGIVEALNDPYTAFLDPQTYQLSTSSFQGKYQGIGATIGVRDKQIIIIAPIPDSPADKAGLKAGDAVLEVDGVSTSGMSPAEVALRVRGPKGTSVRLLILHQGETAPVEIEIVRAEINLPSVYFQMRGQIAYIRITSFSERTNDELIPVLSAMTNQGATGIVMDLRMNPGGLLQTVTDVASHFLKEGVVVYVVDNQGKKTSYPVQTGGTKTNLPMVILTDNYSASGSEVLAGAMQDYGRAVIAGTRTYGKGSADILYELKDGSAIYLTIARWLTPNGRLIEGKGIQPDYELSLTGDDLVQWAIDYLNNKATGQQAEILPLTLATFLT
jgi:carboxyl-terminal processing protease